MHKFKRNDRISGVMQRSLTDTILRELRDPRLPPVLTISDIDLSPDLRNANVYFTSLDNSKHAETLKILNNAAGFLRAALAKSMVLRIVPKLNFVYDSSVEDAKRLSKLIDSVNDETSD
jgi:ribosome-binding factor A